MGIKYDYEKYKYCLREYLARKGIQFHGGNINCLNPAHQDSTASVQINDDSLFCHGCGQKYDIYDCVNFLEGITKSSDQFKFVDDLFGGGGASQLKPYVPKEPKKEEKKIDLEAQKKVLGFLEEITKLNQERIFEFLDTRARYTTQGEIKTYPPQIREWLAKYLYFWPGFEIAEKEIGWQTLVAAGIPGRNKESGKSTWEHSGVVIRIAGGFKLHYYIDDKTKCVKWNCRDSATFPQPYHELTSPLVLVEGEMDALACNAAGLYNVFSAGGTNGLSKPKIQKHLLGVQEVILLFDNDKAGTGMSGARPLTNEDNFSTNLPDKFLQAGFKGKIRVATFPPEYPFKDVDEAIINGKIEDVKTAIANAKEYVPFEKVKKQKSTTAHVSGKKENAETEKKEEPRKYDTITLKHLKSLLNKIDFNSLDTDDQRPFIIAALKACANPDKIKALAVWCEGKIAIDEKEMLQHNYSPYLLLEYCQKYGVSNYLYKELESALIPASEILKNIKEQKTIVKIDFEKVMESENFKQFLMTFAADAAAALIVEIMEGRLKYTESDKKNWFFNGHVWVREPNVAVIISPILSNILRFYLEQNPKEKKSVTKLLAKVGGWTFRTGVAQNINGTKPDVWCENLPFDGPQIRGTLTLLDGVIDFSGKETEYRKSTPEDYRREMLPYTVEEIRNSSTPEKFIKFMKGNFADEKTLETLYYYLSLIPSRNTSYKYGGIFIGKHNTGKSTTLNLIEAIFQGCCARLKSDVLVSVGMKRVSGNEATPEIAKIEGRCAAFVQETARNAMLNTSFWKELTGGDTLTARGLWQQPHDFQPTAQIVIASNYSPNFDAHDDAAISRMVVVPFKIQHSKADKNSRTSNDFLIYLRPEFPAIIKFLVEKYIDLHVNLRGNIPMSTECENYKDLYIEEQKTDLDRFVENCITFDLSDSKNIYERVQDVYNCYLAYYELSPDSKEAMPRPKFTKYLKRDYREIGYGQKRIGNKDPELVFYNIRLNENVMPKPKTETPKNEQQPLFIPPEVPQPEDNPWNDEPDIY